MIENLSLIDQQLTRIKSLQGDPFELTKKQTLLILEEPDRVKELKLLHNRLIRLAVTGMYSLGQDENYFKNQDYETIIGDGYKSLARFPKPDKERVKTFRSQWLNIFNHVYSDDDAFFGLERYKIKQFLSGEQADNFDLEVEFFRLVCLGAFSLTFNIQQTDKIIEYTLQNFWD